MIIKAAVILFTVVLVIGCIVIFFDWHKKVVPLKGEGEPLFLTPYLKNGSLIKAKEAAEVLPFTGKLKSYSGFLTVDDQYYSNLFFWYFPAEEKPKTAAVAVWIQGGPGISSIYGLFLENGPYTIIGSDYAIKAREDYWSKYFHIIYLDSSVGTGFSFTRNESGYPTNGRSVADNLYKALLQLLILFPEIQNNELYIAGELYGGKYVPELSQFIHEQNPTSAIKINLKGLTIGNGLIDPINQMVYSEYLYEIGLIDGNQKKLFEKSQNVFIDLMKNESWFEANHALSDLITNEFGRHSLFNNLTGFKTHSNYLVSHEHNIFKSVDELIKNHSFRREIHVGNLTFTKIGRNRARSMLDHEVMRPSNQLLSQLVENYKVLLYSGQLDVFLSYPGIEKSVKQLSWCGSSVYDEALKKAWKVEGILAGYTKVVSKQNCSGSLTLALVRNSGQLVARDQPVWTLDLIKKFIKNKLLIY